MVVFKIMIIIRTKEETVCFQCRHQQEGSQSSRRSFPAATTLHLSGTHKVIIVIVLIALMVIIVLMVINIIITIKVVITST